MPARTRNQRKTPNSNTNTATRNPTTTPSERDSPREGTAHNPPTKRARVRRNTTSNSLPDSTEEAPPHIDKDTTPNLDNYQDLLSYWPPGRIQKHLQDDKGCTSNRAPPAVQDQVKLIHNRFKQELLMMAMIGGVSEATIKSYM